MSNKLLEAIHNLVAAIENAESVLGSPRGRAVVRERLASQGRWHAAQVLYDLEDIFEAASKIDSATLGEDGT